MMDDINYLVVILFKRNMRLIMEDNGCFLVFFCGVNRHGMADGHGIDVFEVFVDCSLRFFDIIFKYVS